MHPIPMTAHEVLEKYFLEARAKLLEVAATLDRIDRAEGADQAHLDARMRNIDEALAILGDKKPGRAERLQLLFSRQYDPAWLKEFDEYSEQV